MSSSNLLVFVQSPNGLVLAWIVQERRREEGEGKIEAEEHRHWTSPSSSSSLFETHVKEVGLQSPDLDLDKAMSISFQLEKYYV
ncbi:hypothetical protein GBA52_019026 [Prunus armeniaca]|nr:hypothetical protein GBA52_019026 [Prunus armeniaca]